MRYINWLFIIALTAASGCATSNPTPVMQLPVCEYPCRIIDCGNTAQMTFTVLGKGVYLLGDMPTNAYGVSHAILNATQELKYPVPVSIQARPQTRFSDIWTVLAPAGSNGSNVRLLVQVPGIDEPRHLDIAIPSGALNFTNAVVITSTAEGVRVNDNHLSDLQRRQTLSRIASLNDPVPVLLLLGPETFYNNLICYVGECQQAGIQQVYVLAE
jgi:biopolymer transport protein ExbD